MKASDYIKSRKKRDPEFAKGYEEGLADFHVTCLLKAARIKAGLSQEQLAERLHTKRSAISRLERHATDMKISTLEKIADALGKRISIRLV